MLPRLEENVDLKWLKKSVREFKKFVLWIPLKQCLNFILAGVMFFMETEMDDAVVSYLEECYRKGSINSVIRRYIKEGLI